MSRWHKSSCHSPQVSVEDGLPCCESCGSSPDIPKLVSEQSRSNPPWAMPADEKFGEMTLSWPETVLYSPQTRDVAKMESGDFNEAATSGGQDALSPVYTHRLNNDEFRLLYLSAVSDNTQPIHASLEAYQTDDCPEYETVSYCWGGENGDTTFCKPVFLGDYWDILLQTNNCWSMLRYLRPRVGVRVVWVDVICINQKDHQERDSQVAIMGSIYERCLRAVVYLGEDVARSKSNDDRAYPARRDLNKVSAAAVDLHQVLKMRYFQRIWVIQELILAPMVVIPVRGVELTVRRRVATPQKTDWNQRKAPWVRDGVEATSEQVAWHESDVPWMGHMCTGRPDPALRRIMEQTRNSQSTDTRDRVFGLLGLLAGGKTLRPNYLLSSLHIYIGAIAHMLLNEGYSYLLTEAAGSNASPTVPSWLPDGNLSNIGVLLRSLSHPTSRKYVTLRDSSTEEFWAEALKLNPGWEILGTATHGQGGYDSGRPDEVFGPLETKLPHAGKPWVHSSTSALSLPLIYLWGSSSSRTVTIRAVGGASSAFELTDSHCTLYICTPDTSLDRVNSPELSSLFLFINSRDPPLILFMRRLRPGGNYRLIKCCPCFGIFLSREPPSKSNLPVLAWPRDLPVPGMDMYNDGFSFNRDSIPMLHRTVYEAVSETVSLRTKSVETLQWMKAKVDALNPETVTSDIFGLFYMLSESLGTRFVELYFNVLRQCCPDCCVEERTYGGEILVFVTMGPEDWLGVHECLNPDWLGNVFHGPFLDSAFGRHFMGPQSLDHPGPWYWARVPGSRGSFREADLDRWNIDFRLATHELSSWVVTAEREKRRTPATGWLTSERVTMVAKAEGLRKWLQSSHYFKHLSDLRACCRLVNEDIWTLTTTAPKPEYRSIALYDWPESFFGGEHVPGKQDMITIF